MNGRENMDFMVCSAIKCINSYLDIQEYNNLPKTALYGTNKFSPSWWGFLLYTSAGQNAESKLNWWSPSTITIRSKSWHKKTVQPLKSFLTGKRNNNQGKPVTTDSQTKWNWQPTFETSKARLMKSNQTKWNILSNHWKKHRYFAKHLELMLSITGWPSCTNDNQATRHCPPLPGIYRLTTGVVNHKLNRSGKADTFKTPQ